MKRFHRVLIADKGGATRELLESILRPHSDQVAFASHFDEVLAALREFEYDLLVVDIALPGGGLRLLEQIRSRSRTRPAVVTLSQHPSLHEEAEASLSGAIGYLPLPLQLDEVAALLRSLQA